jgi:hypothetical protein
MEEREPMGEATTWQHRTPAEQLVIEQLWQKKTEAKPYTAYCTATEPLLLRHFTGRWEKHEPVMKDVAVAAGQTLRIG